MATMVKKKNGRAAKSKASAKKAIARGHNNGGVAADSGDGRRNLDRAKIAKADEFYTQSSDIEKELKHYKNHFKGKTVYCNCDDPHVSKFFHYFSHKFGELGLKKLVTTCYKSQNKVEFSRNDKKQAVWLEYTGNKNGGRTPHLEEIGVNRLDGDGDFRSLECIELLKKTDVVVTNPPFSLFREYVAQLVEHNKKFVIIGNKNAITYKEIFSLIQQDRVWVGNTPMGTDMLFDVPPEYARALVETRQEGGSYRMVNGKVMARASSVWFTNLDISRRHEKLVLYKKYNRDEYPEYDNYNAINVNKVSEIPKDYDGAMGVPITFLDKYNPDQFEIVKFRKGDDEKDLSVNGRTPYFRILIRRKTP